MQQTPITGYKVFDKNFQCREHQFSENSEHKLDALPKLCNSGFHFCQKANDCFEYYPFNPENIVCEVTAIGAIDGVPGENDKLCTNVLKVGKRLTWHQVLDLVNQGKGNTGRANSGNRNSGNLNSGNLNSGNRNSGDWNSGDDLTGVLCTKNTKIMLFDTLSNFTLSAWRESEAYWIMRDIVLTQWISWSSMSADEKEMYPRAETSEGYLKRFEYKAAHATWWGKLDARQRKVITSIENFDARQFEQITGIDVKALG